MPTSLSHVSVQIDFHVCGEVNERTEKIRLFCQASEKGVLSSFLSPFLSSSLSPSLFSCLLLFLTPTLPFNPPPPSLSISRLLVR
jgi:hypothetical protein